MSSIELTEEQKNAILFIRENYKKSKFISMGGYAGTGKSTCLKEIAKFFPSFAICAYTGKACNVLKRKGVYTAETIHSTIYDVKTDENNDPVFTLKRKNNIGCGGFIVDESSMVSEEIFDNLLWYSLPIIFIGDHGQLEPIGTDFNLMKNPDIKLETIHRNANNIAKFADYLRKGGEAVKYESPDNTVIIKKKGSIAVDEMKNSDQIICAYNKTRLSINNFMRKQYKFEDKINPGEKIICLKNNRNLGIFNGMQVVVESIRGRRLIFRNDLGKKFDILVDSNQFGVEKLLESANRDSEQGYFDYAFCITCHKSQGDEWNKILVLEEKSSIWDHKRWAYTAASRAREGIIWAV
jgi:exodeoxyribonuclease-5